MNATANAATSSAPAYVAGERVLVRQVDSPGHIRTPHYIRGKTGTIERFVGFSKIRRNSLMAAAASLCARCTACASCNPRCGRITRGLPAIRWTSICMSTGCGRKHHDE